MAEETRQAETAWSGARRAPAPRWSRAAQGFIAEGRTNVPILEITQAADVGMGSFYNHFETKEELFDAAVEDALDAFGAALDQLTAGIDDPAAGLRAELPADRPAAPPPARAEPGAAAQRPRPGSARTTGWRPAPAATSKPPSTPAGSPSATPTSPWRSWRAPRCASASCCTTTRTATTPRPPTRSTEDLLRMLGVPADEAHDICQRPLPDPDDLPRRDTAA